MSFGRPDTRSYTKLSHPLSVRTLGVCIGVTPTLRCSTKSRLVVGPIVERGGVEMRNLTTRWMARTTYGVGWQNGVATPLSSVRLVRTRPRWASPGPGTKRRGGLRPSRRTPNPPSAVQAPEGFSSLDDLGDRLYLRAGTGAPEPLLNSRIGAPHPGKLDETHAMRSHVRSSARVQQHLDRSFLVGKSGEG